MIMVFWKHFIYKGRSFGIPHFKDLVAENSHSAFSKYASGKFAERVIPLRVQFAQASWRHGSQTGWLAGAWKGLFSEKHPMWLTRLSLVPVSLYLKPIPRHHSVPNYESTVAVMLFGS